jgi:hypothetical protein
MLSFRPFNAPHSTEGTLHKHFWALELDVTSHFFCTHEPKFTATQQGATRVILFAFFNVLDVLSVGHFISTEFTPEDQFVKLAFDDSV